MAHGATYVDVEGPLRAWARTATPSAAGRVFFGAGSGVTYPWVKVSLIDLGIAPGTPEHRVMMQFDVVGEAIERGGTKADVMAPTWELINAAEAASSVDLATDDPATQLRLLGARVTAVSWRPTDDGRPRNRVDVEFTVVVVPS